jgi:hypothetical protein
MHGQIKDTDEILVGNDVGGLVGPPVGGDVGGLVGGDVGAVATTIFL